MSDKLKPCPFCGSKDVDLWPMNGFESPCCMSCGATIAEAISTGEDTAKQIKAWNTRADNKPILDELAKEAQEMGLYD